MKRRTSEWLERAASIAILVISLVALCDVRTRVLAADDDLDRREQRLDRVANWSERTDAGFLAAEADQPPLFPGYRLVPQRSSAGVHLMLASGKAAR